MWGTIKVIIKVRPLIDRGNDDLMQWNVKSENTITPTDSVRRSEAGFQFAFETALSDYELDLLQSDLSLDEDLFISLRRRPGLLRVKCNDNVHVLNETGYSSGDTTPAETPRRHDMRIDSSPSTPESTLREGLKNVLDEYMELEELTVLEKPFLEDERHSTNNAALTKRAFLKDENASQAFRMESLPKKFKAREKELESSFQLAWKGCINNSHSKFHSMYSTSEKPLADLKLGDDFEKKVSIFRENVDQQKTFMESLENVSIQNGPPEESTEESLKEMDFQQNPWKELESAKSLIIKEIKSLTAQIPGPSSKSFSDLFLVFLKTIISKEDEIIKTLKNCFDQKKLKQLVEANNNLSEENLEKNNRIEKITSLLKNKCDVLYEYKTKLEILMLDCDHLNLQMEKRKLSVEKYKDDIENLRIESAKELNLLKDKVMEEEIKSAGLSKQLRDLNNKNRALLQEFETTREKCMELEAANKKLKKKIRNSTRNTRVEKKIEDLMDVNRSLEKNLEGASNRITDLLDSRSRVMQNLANLKGKVAKVKIKNKELKKAVYAFKLRQNHSDLENKRKKEVKDRRSLSFLQKENKELKEKIVKVERLCKKLRLNQRDQSVQCKMEEKIYLSGTSSGIVGELKLIEKQEKEKALMRQLCRSMAALDLRK